MAKRWTEAQKRAAKKRLRAARKRKGASYRTKHERKVLRAQVNSLKKAIIKLDRIVG